MLDYALSQIGFTDREARVYIELLGIGAQPASIIAKRLNLNRSSTYSLLKSLSKRGIISSFNKNGIKCFSANDPNCLVSYLDSRRRSLEYYGNELFAAIPKLRNMYKSFVSKKPVVSFYDGLDGAKYVMSDSLAVESEYFYSYLCLDKWLGAGLKDFIIDYREVRIRERKIPMKGIVADSLNVRNFFDENYDEAQKAMTDIVYIDPAGAGSMFNNEMNIYGDRVAIMHLEKGNEYGVLVENAEIAEMHKAIFEMVWKGIKE